MHCFCMTSSLVLVAGMNNFKLLSEFNLLMGFEKVGRSRFFTRAENCSTRGHSLKLYKPTLHKNLNCRKHFFSQRVINDWNELPKEVVSAKTITQFKARLASHWGMNQDRYGVFKAEA